MLNLGQKSYTGIRQNNEHTTQVLFASGKPQSIGPSCGVNESASVLPTHCILCRNGKLDQNLLMPKAISHLIHLIGEARSLSTTGKLLL